MDVFINSVCKFMAVCFTFVCLICLGLAPSLPAYAKGEELVILTTFSNEPLVPLVKEFNRMHTDVKVKVIHRRASSSLQLLKKSYSDHIDLLLTSSPYIINHLANANKLGEVDHSHHTQAKLQPYILPAPKQAMPIGYSGAGITWNQDYLDTHHLPTPSKFIDLANPAYFGHVTMSTPSRSGTTKLMLESQLTQYGWEQGWRNIMNVAANLATLSSRSFGVSDAIAKGSQGLGPTIDSYAHILQRKLDYVKFSYDTDFTLMPTYVAVIKRDQIDQAAQDFIAMLRSEKVQSFMWQSNFAKHSMQNMALAQQEHVALNLDTMMTREYGITFLFDVAVTQQLPVLTDTWQAIIQAQQQTLSNQHNSRRSQGSTHSKETTDKKADSSNYQENPILLAVQQLLFEAPMTEAEFEQHVARLAKLQQVDDHNTAYALAQEEWELLVRQRLHQRHQQISDMLQQFNSQRSVGGL